MTLQVIQNERVQHRRVKLHFEKLSGGSEIFAYSQMKIHFDWSQSNRVEDKCYE